MKTNLIGLFFILIMVSCTGTKSAVSDDKSTTAGINDDKSTTTVSKKSDKLIVGKWKMESFEVFSPDPDPSEGKDIIWEFKDGNEVIISSIEGKSASMNTSQYWINNSIVNVGGELYMYSFEHPFGVSKMSDAKPFGEELWLDSNLDPSLSHDGPLIHFTRIQ